MTRLAAALALILPLVLAGPPLPQASASTAVSPEEQLFIYELNLARWDPQGYADDHGLSLPSSYKPQPPLAVHAALMSSAGFKAQEQLDYGYFAGAQANHCSPVTGICPNRLARNHGYPVPSFWDLNENYIEAAWAATGPSDPGPSVFLSSLIHAELVLGQGWIRHDVGVGLAEECSGGSSTCNFATIHVATRTGGAPYAVSITGVVYDDDNGNGRMDLGEGSPGVTVTAGSQSTKTNAGGGYSIQVDPGIYEVAVAGITERVKVTDWNVGVDFNTKHGEAVARAYSLCRGEEPTIIGTSASDSIVGSNGPDIIHGLGGKDTIDGRAGDDLICGGGSNDTIDGGQDKDVIHGGSGNDIVAGGGWADQVMGAKGDDIVLGDGGPDKVKGGKGNDQLIGGSGQDKLNGGPDIDTCDGEIVNKCE